MSECGVSRQPVTKMLKSSVNEMARLTSGTYLITAVFLVSHTSGCMCVSLINVLKCRISFCPFTHPFNICIANSLNTYMHWLLWLNKKNRFLNMWSNGKYNLLQNTWTCWVKYNKHSLKCIAELERKQGISPATRTEVETNSNRLSKYDIGDQPLQALGFNGGNRQGRGPMQNKKLEFRFSHKFRILKDSLFQWKTRKTRKKNLLSRKEKWKIL